MCACVCVCVSQSYEPPEPSVRPLRTATIRRPPPHQSPKSGQNAHARFPRARWRAKQTQNYAFHFAPRVCVCSVCVCERACSPPALTLCTRAHPMLLRRGARAMVVVVVYGKLYVLVRACPCALAQYTSDNTTHTHEQHACARALKAHTHTHPHIYV